MFMGHGVTLEDSHPMCTPELLAAVVQSFCRSKKSLRSRAMASGDERLVMASGEELNHEEI